MRKRIVSLLLAAAAAWMLCACSMLDQEYVSIRDYQPEEQENPGAPGRLSIHSYAALKSALLSMAYAGQSHGNLVFDAAYDGDVNEDLKQACREVRADDALCAYCVQNISYEVNKLISVNAAGISISFSPNSQNPQEIEHLGFSSEAGGSILNAMRTGSRKLTLLVSRSGFSAEDMEAQVIRTYRDNPTVLPKEPSAEVSVYSGTGSQRLYEIHIDYGVPDETLRHSRKEFAAFKPFEGKDIERMGEAERAYAACRYLLENCEITDDEDANSAYSALIEKRADSEGAAFGYVELCRQLGIDCRIVYGQLNWRDHCWNIIRIDDSYYHADITQCARGGPALGFLRSDESLWGSYRWDVASYPKCADSRSFFDFFPPAVLTSDGTADAE